MGSEWVPMRESELRDFSNQFAAAISADPTAYGLTLGDASDFEALNTAWVNAYTAATNSATRGDLTIQAKNDAKAAMLPQLRSLGMFIQNRPATTNEQRVMLGLTVPAVEPSPVPVPGSAPLIVVESKYNRSIDLRFKDVANPDNDGKPEGVIGLALFSWVGATPPADLKDWKFEGNTTRVRATVTFPVDVPYASQVWFTAFWFNTKAQSGPATHPPLPAFLDSGMAGAA